MICEVVEELEKSKTNVESFKNFLFQDDRVNPAVYHSAMTWSELIKSFRTHQMISKVYPDWIFFIADRYAHSSGAVRAIKCYYENETVKNTLIIDVLPWEKPDYSEKSYLYVKTNEEPETATIENLHKAKDAAIALNGGQVNPLHARPHSASVGCVTYYFEIPLEIGCGLKLPQTITTEIEQLCNDAKIIRIGVMAGNRNESVEIANLRGVESMNECVILFLCIPM